MNAFKYTILVLTLVTTGALFTVGPVSMQSMQLQKAHAQSGLLSALGSGAAQGLGSCAASIGTNVLGGLLSGVLGSLKSSVLGGLNPLQVPVTDGGTQANVQQNSLSRVAREGCLDGIMYFAAKEVLNQLADSTVEWIQSDFTQFGQTGNRGHVGDLNSFLNNTTDAAFNEFYGDLAQGGGDGICGSYKEQVMLSIAGQHYAENEQPSGVQPSDAIEGLPNLSGDGGTNCPVEEYLGEDGAEDFFNGDFQEGGWAAFSHSVENPNSSPIGAYLQQNSRVTQRIQQARDLDLEQLQQSNGWLDAVACPNGEDSLDDATGKCRDGDGNLIEPVVQTPGSAVNETINNVIGSDFRRLELADETNEIVGALMNQLVSNIAGSDTGGLFDESITERTDALGNTSSYGSGNTTGFQGRIPEEYIMERLNEQIELESNLLAAVEQLPTTYQLSELEARINQCLVDGSLAEQDNVEQQVQSMRVAKQSVMPSTRNASGEEREVGPQKIDWVGNDLQWTQGESQGTNECTQHAQAYEGSYVPDIESGEWQLFMCLPDKSGTFNETVTSLSGKFSEIGDTSIAPMIEESRPLYRSPRNDVIKVDWNGAEFDWKHYDIFAEEFTDYVHDAYEPYAGGSPSQVKISGEGENYTPPGTVLNTLGSDGEGEIEQIDRILQKTHNNDTNRYGATGCDERTVGQMSYVVKPNADEWTHQECQEVTNTRGDSVYRFINTGEASPAFQSAEVVNQIDGYLREIRNLLGDENYDSGNWQEPSGEPDNLRELLHDFETIEEGIEGDESIAQRKQYIDERFARMESRFHTQEDLSAAQEALEQLNPENPESTFSQLEQIADNNNCQVPDDWEPPTSPTPDDDGTDGSGTSEGELSIVSFNAKRPQNSGIITVSWETTGADSCRAESTPDVRGWNGPVGTTGTGQIVDTQNSVRLSLVCETGDQMVARNRYIEAYSSDYNTPQR